MSRGLRVTLLWIGGVVLALMLAGLVLTYVMLRPERFTETLRKSAREAGLELTLTAPAHPTLWPRPGVQLQGLQVFAMNQADPVLIADHGQIVVPWRVLFGGSTAINKLELDSPRLDLGQLQYALASLPTGTSNAPRLPSIDAGITIRNGTLVRDDALLMQDVSIQTGTLANDHAFSLNASGEASSGKRLRLNLTFTPREGSKAAIDLADVNLDAYAGKDSRIHLGGSAQWLGGARLTIALHGDMVVDDKNRYSIDIGSDDANAHPGGRLHVRLQGPAANADLHLSPQELAAWWQRVAGDHAPGALPPPPVDGSVDADEIDLGGIQVKGLQVRSGAAVPASAQSAAPAAGTGAK